MSRKENLPSDTDALTTGGRLKLARIGSGLSLPQLVPLTAYTEKTFGE